MSDVVNLAEERTDGIGVDIEEPQVDEELLARKKEAIKQLPKFRGEVYSKNNIRSLPDTNTGDIFWVESDNMAYIVADKDKKKITIKALDETATISTGMTIFEMNKKIISREPLFDFEDEAAVKELKDKFLTWINEKQDTYFLAYGRDIHYVSLFEVDCYAEDDAFDIFIETIGNVGKLISMDFDEYEASIEIWIRTADSRAELMYLFPYDQGIIKLG